MASSRYGTARPSVDNRVNVYLIHTLFPNSGYTCKVLEKERLNMSINLEANKENAIAFYKTAYLGNPAAAVAKYVGDEYIQHNPLVANGKQAFIDYFEEMARDYPDKRIEFIRAVAEGDLVALHTHQIWPGNVEYVTMDFFRFDESGKIVEHWDSVQEIPDETKNGNPMY